jgi:chromosomal replication initiator protein
MNPDTLWKTVLAELELTITPTVFKTLFAKSKLLSLQNNVASIGIANPMMRQMIETKYYSLIKSIVDHHTKENISLIFTILPKKETLEEEAAGPLFAQQTKNIKVDTQALVRKYHIRPDATFDTFAVSPTNQIAHAAATAVAKSPGTAYNPLFLYGGVGVGKTHLMHAVANELLSKRPALRVVYSMGEEFLNEIVNAIQTKSSRQFKQRYRSAQLLLIDDVQFIAGKQTAQEEFFHTFNAVHREGGQIILTSDRPPSEIAKLEDRLRSRFEGGLTVDVAQPDFELRVAIINIKSQALNLTIPPNVAQLIASTLTDTRAMEGFLRKLLNHTTIHKAPITKELAAKLLNVTPPKEDNTEGNEGQKRFTRITPLDVLDAVANYFNVKPMHLKGPKRDRPIARPRQLVMYICMTELKVTLDDVGGLLGGRDHTTVMHGVDKIKSEIETDARLREALAHIKSTLFS